MIAKTLCIEQDVSDKAIKLLSLFMPRYTFTPGGEDSTIVAQKCDGISPSPEGYALNIKDNRVSIKYQTYTGLRNAFATLSLKAREKDGVLFFEDTDMVDAPVISHRGIMLDQARGVMPIERVFQDMVLIAKAKFNILHLHLADSKGISIEVHCLPKAFWLDGYFTKEKVKELVAFADLLALEIIPEFDMPGHSTLLNELIPGIRCDTELEAPCLWTTCAGSENTYALYKNIIQEISAMFPDSRYFHIGGDELEFLDLKRFCHWMECKTCRKKMEEEGLADRQELVYYLINRINGLVKECGKQAIIWSDQVDCTRPKGLDDDIILQFWRIAAAGRGPREGCSFDGQLKFGNRAINSFFPNTYIDFERYANPENLGQWRWDEIPEVSEQHKSQIIGAETCAWEYGNRKNYTHYDYSLPSSIFLFGNKFWDGKKEVYDKNTAITLTRAVLGSATPQGFDVFAAVGSIMPPKLTAPGEVYIPCYPEKVTISKEEILDIIKTLSDPTLFTGDDRKRAELYKACAESALKEMDSVKKQATSDQMQTDENGMPVEVNQLFS